MKKNYLVLSLSLVFGLILQSCSNKENKVNSFTSDQDTLRVQMVKVKGGGLFSFGYGVINFNKYKSNLPTKIIKPEDIDSIERYPLEVDLIEKKMEGVQNL